MCPNPSIERTHNGGHNVSLRHGCCRRCVPLMSNVRPHNAPMRIESLRSVAEWLALSALVVVGFMYLNGAFFAAWVAGGPPTDYRLGWERRSLAHLSFSAAAFVASAAVFRLIGRLPKKDTPAYVLLVLTATLVAAPYIGRFILASSCVSSGSRWSNLTIECTK
jgi:hypothetical protein